MRMKGPLEKFLIEYKNVNERNGLSKKNFKAKIEKNWVYQLQNAN